MLMVVSSIDYRIATKNTMTVKPIFNRLLAGTVYRPEPVHVKLGSPVLQEKAVYMGTSDRAQVHTARRLSRGSRQAPHRSPPPSRATPAASSQVLSCVHPFV